VTAPYDRMNAHRPFVANDRAPREKRPLVERFAESVNRAMFAIYFASAAGIVLALSLGEPRAAWLFLGAMLTSASTEIIVWLFLRRLRP
jgi:Kef-type K+ transport system membrane component KefB